MNSVITMAAHSLSLLLLLGQPGFSIVGGGNRKWHVINGGFACHSNVYTKFPSIYNFPFS